jgi:hypothetical protein
MRLKVSRFNELNDPFELLASDLLNPKHKTAFFAFKNQLNATKGMICFSGNWNNPLLWGHYGEKHKGIALGFEIPNDRLTSVQYTSQRAKVNFDVSTGKIKNGPEVVDSLIRTKFSDWRYEDEYRMFVDLNSAPSDSGQYFVDFDSDLILTEVVLGLNCELPINKMRSLLQMFDKPVRVLKAGMALRSFKLIEDRQYRK